jgi:hypothetical protein
MTNASNAKPGQLRRQWVKPVIRHVLPTARTRGGAYPANRPEAPHYYFPS